MKIPKVSIITPIYNNSVEEYTRTRNSIKDQTSDDYEWIVVDDGSEGTGLLYSNVYLENNHGPSVARNVGISLSKGDIITYADCGDTLSKRKIEHIIDMFEEHPRTQLLFDSYIIKQNGDQYFNNVYNIHSKIRKMLQLQNVSTPLGVAHTRKIFYEVGGFQPGIVCGEDGILWRRMSEKLENDEILITDFTAGTYYVEVNSQARTQRRFDEGGFAFDMNDPQGYHGQYLDESWYKTYSSKEFYE